jgi:hypothetical protein
MMFLSAVSFAGQPYAGIDYPPGAGWQAHIVQGTYIIPVQTSLARYASFYTPYRLTTSSDGKLRIDYCLPEDVVGPGIPSIHLEETKNNTIGLIEVEGTWGRGTCRKVDSGLTCFIIYPGLPLEHQKVEAYLRAKYPTGGSDVALLDDNETLPPGLLARLNVATVFSADPKGIINIQFRK